MITYKKYKEECLEKAKLNDWFDENGNSITATANRSFIKEMRLDAKRLALCFIDVELKEFIIRFFGLVVLILSPILFVPLLICRSYFSRKRANKEMMEYYIKDVVKNN